MKNKFELLFPLFCLFQMILTPWRRTHANMLPLCPWSRAQSPHICVNCFQYNCAKSADTAFSHHSYRRLTKSFQITVRRDKLTNQPIYLFLLTYLLIALASVFFSTFNFIYLIFSLYPVFLFYFILYKQYRKCIKLEQPEMWSSCGWQL